MTMNRPQSVPEQAFWSDEDNEWILAERDSDGEYHGLVKYFRPDGTLCCATNFVGGTPHGEFRRFHQNGEVSRSGVFVEGTLHGTNVFVRSTASTSETFPPGLPEVIWRCEMDYSEGQVVEGRLFDRFGQRVMEDGNPFPSQRPAGVAATAHFRKTKDGDYRWVDGQVRDNGNGTLTRLGTWRYWSPEGVLVREESYEGGELDGVVREYAEDTGALVSEERYANGERQYDRPGGVPADAEFDEDDEVWSLVPSDENGQTHGDVLVWDTDGLLRLRETHQHGSCAAVQEYLADGSLAQHSEFFDGGVPRRKWFRRTDGEALDSFPNVLDEHPSAHEVDYLFDAHGMMTRYRIVDENGKVLEDKALYRNAGADVDQTLFKHVKAASREWIAEGQRYTSQLNAWLAELYETGEPSAEEPTFDRHDLERAVIEGVEQLNREGRAREARELFPLYYDGIGKAFWHNYGLVIDRVLHTGNAVYARIDPPVGDAYVVRVQDQRVEKIPGLVAFGSSHDKRYVALAYDDHVDVTGPNGTQKLGYPTRYGHAGADRLRIEKLGTGRGMRVREVRVCPDGSALVITGEGIYLYTQGQPQRLYPLDGMLDEYVEHFVEQAGDAVQDYVFDLGVRFANADVAPRGDLITCGGMFRRGFMAGLAMYARAADGSVRLRNTSQADAFFPIQAVFHRERPHVAFAACLYASLHNKMTNTTFRIDLEGLEEGDLQSFGGGVAQERGVVQTIASFGEGFLLGFDNGYIRWMGVQENVQLLGYLFVGGSVQHIDVSPDQRTFAVVSDAGLVSEFTLADKPSPNLIATMPVTDKARTAFFRTFAPLIW